MLQENWWQQDRSGQGMNERRNFAKGKRQQRWPATHIVKEEVVGTRAKHGGEVPIEQMCFDEGWDTLGDDKSRSPTRGAHIVRACTTAWSTPGGRLALIADIYISISTGTFDIENIKYEKKWQQLDLDTNFEP